MLEDAAKLSVLLTVWWTVACAKLSVSQCLEALNNETLHQILNVEQKKNSLHLWSCYHKSWCRKINPSIHLNGFVNLLQWVFCFIWSWNIKFHYVLFIDITCSLLLMNFVFFEFWFFYYQVIQTTDLCIGIVMAVVPRQEMECSTTACRLSSVWCRPTVCWNIVVYYPSLPPTYCWIILCGVCNGKLLIDVWYKSWLTESMNALSNYNMLMRYSTVLIC